MITQMAALLRWFSYRRRLNVSKHKALSELKAIAKDPRKTARKQIHKTLSDPNHYAAMQRIGKNVLEVPHDDNAR